MNSKNNDAKDDSKQADMHGTVSGGDQPPQKIKIFFSNKIWLTIISFLALTIIGGIIEFTVQTPISRYIERFTGPQYKTLKKQIKAGNYEFVFRNIKQKFHDKPENKIYKRLYAQSSEGYLNQLVTDHDWNKASIFLNEAAEGMPVSQELRLNLRRLYIGAQAERYKVFKQRKKGQQEEDRLVNMFEEIKLLALKEKDDPIIQYEAGRASAELTMQNGMYYAPSIIYFENALELGLKDTDQQIIYNVLDQVLEKDPQNKLAVKAKNIIQKYYIEKYAEKLRDMLKSVPFSKVQQFEPIQDWNKRVNAFNILSKSGKLDKVDEFKFYVLTSAHCRLTNAYNTKLVNQAKEYVKKIEKEKTFEELKTQAQFPKIVPASVLSKSEDSEEFKAAWPLVSGILAPIFEGYCEDRLVYEPNKNLQKNTFKLLKKLGVY
ncbi:MAG: hypothetical protein ABII23_08125 [bacterium]